MRLLNLALLIIIISNHQSSSEIISRSKHDEYHNSLRSLAVVLQTAWFAYYFCTALCAGHNVLISVAILHR
jgi:hypothetical protein